MSFGGSEVNVYDRVLRIQQIALRKCFDPRMLKRLQNQQLMIDAPTDNNEKNDEKNSEKNDAEEEMNR